MHYADFTREKQLEAQWRLLRIRLREASLTAPEQKYRILMCTLAAGLSCYARASIRRDVYTCSYLQNADCDFSEICACENFQRLPGIEDLPWIETLYHPDTDCYALRCAILFDGYSLGSLLVLRQGNPFQAEEIFLADYVALLCTGFNQFMDYGRSHLTHLTLRAAYRGEPLNTDGLALLPEQGYALILHGNIASGNDSSKVPDSNDYYTELLYAYFGESTFSTFRRKNADILLFTDTSDIHAYVKEVKALFKQHNREPIIGVSSRRGKGKISSAFSEARRAFEIGIRLYPDKHVYYFDNLGIYRFFTYPENTAYVDHTLKQLQGRLAVCAPDKKHALLDTLDCFIRNDFNYSSTAEELFTHPNTVRYRIAQLMELLGLDLRSPEDRLTTEILWQMYHLWDKKDENHETS